MDIISVVSTNHFYHSMLDSKQQFFFSFIFVLVLCFFNINAQLLFFVVRETTCSWVGRWVFAFYHLY